jgi:DNA (cytosine-5)-methyltransferase 1
MPNADRPKAIDLFAGAGGATQGLRDAGFDVIAAVEIDKDAAATYRLNHPDARVWESDITKIAATKMRDDLGLEEGELALLKACPPCQGFSSLAEGRIAANDARNELVGHTIRFVRAFRPQSVLLENVPGLGRDRRLTELLAALYELGYAAKSYIVNASDFGVPQRRRRLIVVALRGLRSTLPERLTPEDPETPVSVRKAFEDLKKSVQIEDALNTARTVSPTVQRRIEAIPIGGNRFDLPEDLRLDCHVKMDKRGATGSYARMKWDEPSSTMTTRCTTPSSGPFIHPSENRPITLREAATLQTFPTNYRFSGTSGSIERQIGNAVPVRMATKIAKILLPSVSPRAAEPRAAASSAH